MTQVRNADTFVRRLGFPEAYRVGGSVRDELLGRKPKDADYVIRGATVDAIRAAVTRAGAKPSKLQLRDGRIVGVRAAVRGMGLVEIAMPRTEVSTGAGHRDFEIITDPDLTLAQDAERRDFTINALYRNVHTHEIVDPLGGVQDIERRLIDTTHPDSFRDDPLRILRALRFYAVLPNFQLGSEAREEMHEHADAVTGLTDKGVSGTAFDELCKMLVGANVADAMRLMRDTGVMAVFLPELAAMIGYNQNSQYHDMTTDEHTFAAMAAAASLHCDLRVMLALLFHDSGKPEAAWIGDDGRAHYYAKDGTEDHETIGARLAQAALTRLNTPRKLRQDVVKLVENHMVPVNGRTKPSKVRKWRVEFGDELLRDLFMHRLADCAGKGAVDYNAIKAIQRLEAIRQDAENANIPTKPSDLPISGRDIIDLGLEGAAIGRVLKQLLHEVVSQPDRNDRDWLLARAEKLAAKERNR